MGTEIGRNFGDVDRYNLLPVSVFANYSTRLEMTGDKCYK